MLAVTLIAMDMHDRQDVLHIHPFPYTVNDS